MLQPQRLAALIAQADGRVEVVLGGGIAAATLAALLEQLPHTGAVSLHAYGSVLSAGRVDAGKVAELVRMAQIAG